MSRPLHLVGRILRSWLTVLGYCAVITAVLFVLVGAAAAGLWLALEHLARGLAG